MAIITKKGRLIWQEYIGSLGVSCIDPNVSFDRGKTWMSLINKASNLRLGSVINGGNIREKEDGFNELDISFGFTPYAIPAINGHDVEADAVNGLAAGTYYFAASSLSYDTPGMEEVTTNNYYTGPKNVPISKLYKVELSEKSNVNLYINYPSNTKGLCIYYGTSTGSTVDLKLYHVTNFVQKLKTNISDTSTASIELLHIYPLPKTGTIKIDNEYISYTDCTWDTDHYELSGITRGVNNSTATVHEFTGSNNIPIYYAEYTGGNYGELPEKLYPIVDIPANLEQYLNFDSANILDLTGNETRSPAIIGDLGYENFSNTFNFSLKLTGIGILNPDIALNNASGTIHTYLMFEDFNQNETEDPYIFGSDTGLWIKISKFNLKPYFGVGDITLLSYEDKRISGLYKNDFSQIGLSWEIDSVTGNMTFYLSINGFEPLIIESEIESSEFDAGSPYIGGLYSGSTFSNTFIGVLDDWRVYDICLSYNDFVEINEGIINSIDIHNGKVLINSNYWDLSTTDDIHLYEPLIYKSFTGLSTTEGEAGENYGLYYDDWAIQAYYTDGFVPSGENITYPINPESIQFMFKMNDNGEGTGFNSPIIKDISIIVSEMSLS